MCPFTHSFKRCYKFCERGQSAVFTSRFLPNLLATVNLNTEPLWMSQRSSLSTKNVPQGGQWSIRSEWGSEEQSYPSLENTCCNTSCCLCLQSCTSVAPWTPLWASWNCLRARSRIQKTMPSSTWTCLPKAWWIANRGRTPTPTGLIPSRFSRYGGHRAQSHQGWFKQAVHLFGSSLMLRLSSDSLQILY